MRSVTAGRQRATLVRMVLVNMKCLMFLAVAIATTAITITGQSRTAYRLYRPCPGVGQQARLEMRPNGQLVSVPCPASPNVMTVGSDNFVPWLTGAKTLFTVGSPQFFDWPNHLLVNLTDVKWRQTGAVGKIFAGNTIRMYAEGTGTNNSYIGEWIYLANNTDDGGTNNMVGTNYFLNVEHRVNQASGVEIGVAIGSGFAGTGTSLLRGIRSVVGVAHNGGATQMGIAGDFSINSSLGGSAVVPNTYLLRAQYNTNTAATITNAYGLSFNNWTYTGGITNSYAIYADETIDAGTTNRYFIYSLAKSPSFFSGRMDFDKNTSPYPTGDATINKPSFVVNIPPSAASVTVSNSFITTTSHVVCTPQQADASGTVLRAVIVNSGSTVIMMNQPVSAATQIACIVFG